jgi:dihydroxyacid dehydratase/phosphogluconate dehydratase
MTDNQQPTTNDRQPATNLIEAADPAVYEVSTHAPGPAGSLPLDAKFLLNAPSGDVFGLSQDTGMGWDPKRVRDREFLILSTQGGIRAPDGRPVALGYHTGHFEVGLLVQEAAETFERLGATPFAAFVTDPCDGRTQGTVGMMDSLAYRNDAAVVLRRLIRSLPTRKGVMGVATCDKGLPAMMIALAAQHRLPVILVPGGVTLPPTQGEDAGTIQTVGARFSHGQITLEEAAEFIRHWPLPASLSGSTWPCVRRRPCRPWNRTASWPPTF